MTRHLAALGAAAALSSSVLLAQSASIEGFVYDAETCEGVPRLTIALTAVPSALGGRTAADVVARTDERGKFQMQVQPGTYAVDVRVGLDVLVRDRVEIATATYWAEAVKGRRQGAATQSPTFKVQLQKGSHGPEVLVLQRRLGEMGLYRGARDGVFGAMLEDAVRRFQKAHGIKPDGNLHGERSWGAIVCGLEQR